MKLNTSLAVGVVALLIGGSAVFAQDAPKPATSVQKEAPEKIQKVLGTYKSDTAGPPVITLAWKDGKLMMEAGGFPALEVTLGEKGALKSSVLPEAFKFTLVLDADGKATALKMETPMGGFELKRLPGKPAEETKKADDVPDVLGVYEPTEKVDGAKPAEVVFEKGKLWVKIEGQPPFPFTIGKDDKLVVEPALPEGTSIKLVRDSGGKVVGSEYSGPEGTMKFKRKLPKSEFPDVLGKYEADDAASPIPGGEIVIEGGSLVLRVDGQPDFPIKIDKDGNILSDKFPEGVTSKIRKDKDGKITGMDADSPLGKLGFTRKTFVPLPGGAAKTEDPKLARYKEIAGTYKAEMEGIPTITILVKDGKLIVQAEGQPAIEGDLSKDDKLTADKLPAGFELKITRDKDGKVTGLHADTPMGSADFKFTPEKTEKKA